MRTTQVSCGTRREHAHVSKAVHMAQLSRSVILHSQHATPQDLCNSFLVAGTTWPPCFSSRGSSTLMHAKTARLPLLSSSSSNVATLNPGSTAPLHFSITTLQPSSGVKDAVLDLAGTACTGPRRNPLHCVCPGIPRRWPTPRPQAPPQSLRWENMVAPRWGRSTFHQIA